MKRSIGWLACLIVLSLLASCGSGGGGGTAASAPSVSAFNASTGTANGVVTSGDKATLAWSLAGGAPSSVSVRPGVGAIGATSVDVAPARTTTYTLTVSNAAGSDTATVTVKVGIRATAIAMTGAHGLAVDATGHMVAWGRNAEGELGVGAPGDSPTALPVDTGSGLGAVQKIAAGGLYSVAQDQSGALWAWGADSLGQLGDSGASGSGGSSVPVQVTATSLNGVKAFSAGNMHTVAIDGNDAGWAWGYNFNGQLGTYDNTTRPSPYAVSAIDLASVAVVSSGWSHTLAIGPYGEIWAWGADDSSQLGDGLTGDVNHPERITISNPGDYFTAVAAGGQHSLAIFRDGTVYAWGANGHKQLGDGGTSNATTPEHLTDADLTGVTAIAAGGSHSLALRDDGSVWAWGDDSAGELGDGGNIDRGKAVQVSGLSHVTAIAAGDRVSLALRDDGSVWAWGLNDQGQLGNGTTSNSTVPVQVLTTP